MASYLEDLLGGKIVDKGIDAISDLISSNIKTFGDLFTTDSNASAGVFEEFNNEQYVDAVNSALRSVAAGGYTNQLQSFMKGIDRYQRSVIQTNSEHSGITFITRPRLNLQNIQLDQDRRFAPLNISEPCMAHTIRCLLDTVYSASVDGAVKSDLVNQRSPWFAPLMNGLVGISGFPDPVLQTETTNTGFFSEDQTYAIGYDELNKTYDLSLTFKDPQNGPVATIFYYWLLYMHNLTRGIMGSYVDDVTYRRLNYTVSIYRFRLDPTRQYITGYAKATGCFPKSVPLGAMFNFGESELFAPSVGKFTIPFVANKIEYNDYAIITDFNTLAKRYWSNVDAEGQFVEVDVAASSNFSGVPYISTKEETVDALDHEGLRVDPRLGGTGRYRSGGRPRLTFRVENKDILSQPELDDSAARFRTV